ncbi:DUF3880 domain-containing protein [Paenibacillus sp. Marseille-Q4541]|uniref:CgeB family protein n=1 Tax=Paenibacillus sp. Marseille-Q4541 TaxID=2831522 RepID=UPI0032D589C9
MRSYLDGYAEGIRYGGCEAILQRVKKTESSVRKMKVLYVPQGFEAIDDGVIQALQTTVSECIVADAAHMRERAALYMPDLVLVMNGLHVFPADHLAQIDEIRALGIRTAIWFVDDPYFTEDTASICLHYDLVFTHEIRAVSFYRSQGAVNVYHVPLGVNTSLFTPRKTSASYQYDVCFIGSGFWNRISLFDELAPFLKNKRVLIAGGQWGRLQRQDLLGPFIKTGWIPPTETVDYYNGAKIVINMHRPTEQGLDNRNTHDITAGSINPRTYEINACGTLQLTDIREDLTSYYRPGYDIETFGNVSELQKKIAYYLTHEKERLAVAWRSLYTTHENHSFQQRISKLLDYV